MIDEKYLADFEKSVIENRRYADLGAAIKADSIACDLIDDVFRTMKALWFVARTADKLIYRMDDIYDPNSKKGKLKAALDALKELEQWKTETPSESAPVPSTEKIASMEPEPILKTTNQVESDLKPNADGGSV